MPLSFHPVALRQWAFEQALAVHRLQRVEAVCPDAHDLIYLAGEIERYARRGKNPRRDFFSCVDCAMKEAESHDFPGVSDAKRDAVLAFVTQQLREYKALY